MHATTVRFSSNLWSQLEREAAAEGVSAAQFVRDATLLRLGALAGIREDAAVDDDAVAALAHLVRRHQDPDVHEMLRDPQRLAAVRRAGMLDVPGDAPFRRLVTLACQLLDTPMSAISVLEEDQLVVVERHGVPDDAPRAVDYSQTYCHLMVPDAEPLVIPDARRDPRVCDNPALTDYGVIAYLGVPLVVDDQIVGALCVIDQHPREWGAEDIRLLSDLGASVMAEVEQRSRPVR